ncbi:hypothetical protein MSG28_009491 [Choristoneura fumiferana]|uniref:Uncharacterized protein n=1 Tax=Choristoneura fumiferana TaxID=7141 RepID=A0ACC0JB98_CHOFU|nr:hypothetical protein MSG28_009491 [Choristoneura fumiferana]
MQRKDQMRHQMTAQMFFEQKPGRHFKKISIVLIVENLVTCKGIVVPVLNIHIEVEVVGILEVEIVDILEVEDVECIMLETFTEDEEIIIMRNKEIIIMSILGIVFTLLLLTIPLQYVNEVQNLTDKMIKELRCDNGKEYINARVLQFAKEKGITIKPCPAYVHELNGTAERRKPSVKYLKMYGSKVLVRIPEEKRISKWDKKAEMGILLGYSDTGYRVLINNKVIIARHCDVIEEDVTLCGFEDEKHDNSEEEKDRKRNITEHPDETKLDEVESNNDMKFEKHQEVEKRKRQPPLRFDEEFGYYCITANYCDATTPETFQEAITCKDSSKWKAAMDREMESLVTNKTWTLVDKPPKDKKVIDVKWIYKKKSECEYKARREFGLERFVPSGLLESMKRKEIRRLIAHFLKLNSQMTGSQRQLTQLQAKLHYLDIVAGLPSYGAKCFGSSRPERVLLVSPRFGLSQIVSRANSVPQSIASLEEVEGVRVKRESAGSADVAVFLTRDRVVALLMDERDAAEMPLVIAGYYRLATGQELNVELEREPITEDIAPPYLSQHNVVPVKWSYLHYNDPNVLSKKHFAIFTMPPPYHSTPDQTKSSLDTNMNSSLNNKNHSNNSSPLIGYDSKHGLLGHDVHFEKCKRNDDFRLFDPNDACYLDDGMGFDLQSVLSMELLENACNNPRLVEAKNEAVLRRVAEMQKLVENSEQYLTENCDVYNGDAFSNGVLRDDLKDKLCIIAEEHFSLVVEHVKSVRRNKLTLLDPKESLARIAARPAPKNALPIPNSIHAYVSGRARPEDLAALDYLYMQCCNDVAQERFAPELQPDVALRLAALHMHQHALATTCRPQADR